jgi:pyruvate dehydrogenase E2 component (dihydrolipoamide acetyltransferase)
MGDFRMPSLGADMEAGTLTEWLVKPGQRVKHGDIVAVVETQKGAIEVEIFEDGVIGELRVEPGQKVPVGTVLATVNGGAAGPAEARPAAPPPPPEAERATAAPEPAKAAPAPPQPPPPPQAPAPAGTHLRASPAARRLAEAKGIDLAQLTGTGPGGAISIADVEAAQVKAAGAEAPPAPAAKRPAPAAKAAAASRMAEMRKAIAAAMARSKREIPHYYLSDTVDMGDALEWLRAENERRSVPQRLLPAALLIKAVALALRDVPELNGFYEEGAFRPGPGIHVGVAIALRGGGLIAPALHDTDKKSLDEVQAGLMDLVKRARAGGLRSSELTDATITLTNLGDLGVETVFGVIYPPQVAIVGFGRIEERPWAAGEGGVGLRPLVTVTLSADHRASDGHRGGRLLAAIGAHLHKPEAL